MELLIDTPIPASAVIIPTAIPATAPTGKVLRCFRSGHEPLTRNGQSLLKIAKFRKPGHNQQAPPSFDTSLLDEKDHLTLADQLMAIARQRCIGELIQGNFYSKRSCKRKLCRFLPIGRAADGISDLRLRIFKTMR